MTSAAIFLTAICFVQEHPEYLNDKCKLKSGR